MRSFTRRFTLLLLVLLTTVVPASASSSNLLIYCGITMVRPMTDIARLFEKQEKVTIAIAQGGSEDLYQSARNEPPRVSLYLPGEPAFRVKHQPEGLAG